MEVTITNKRPKRPWGWSSTNSFASHTFRSSILSHSKISSLLASSVMTRATCHPSLVRPKPKQQVRLVRRIRNAKQLLFSVFLSPPLCLHFRDDVQIETILSFRFVRFSDSFISQVNAEIVITPVCFWNLTFLKSEKEHKVSNRWSFYCRDIKMFCTIQNVLQLCILANHLHVKLPRYGFDVLVNNSKDAGAVKRRNTYIRNRLP